MGRVVGRAGGRAGKRVRGGWWRVVAERSGVGVRCESGVMDGGKGDVAGGREGEGRGGQGRAGDLFVMPSRYVCVWLFDLQKRFGSREENNALCASPFFN